MVAGQEALAATQPRSLLLRASAVLLAVAVLSKLVTLAADSFVAARFGLSVDADAYLVAVGLVGALLGAPGETLRLAVVPICGRYLRHGEQRAAAGAVALALVSVLAIGGVVGVALAVAAPWIVPIAAPGFDRAEFATLTDLTRILAIALVAGLALAVLLGVLHTQLRFGVAAVAGIGPSAGVIALGLGLGGALGVRSLAFGYAAGTVGVVAVMAWAARGLFREGAALRSARRDVAPFLRLALPTGLAISIVSAGAVIERAVASATGAGNVAALGFAIKLITQAAVLSQSFWTPLTPVLTASGASSEETGDLGLVPFSLKLMLLVLVPATALLIALREPLVGVIYQRGAFTADDTGRTATLLALHSGSLIGEGVFMVSVAALLSFHNSATRLVASCLFLGCKVIMTVALAPFIGVAGIALAASLSGLVAGAYAFRVLSRRFDRREKRELLVVGGKALLAGALAMAIAAGSSEALASSGAGGTFAGDTLRLAVGGLTAGVVYVTSLVLLDVREAQLAVARMRTAVLGARS